MYRQFHNYSPSERWDYAKEAEAQKIRNKGFGEKYDRAGIYCIKLNDNIVYIGQSVNMLYRIAEHILKIRMPDEHKYFVLNEAKGKIEITFDVLCYVNQDFFMNIETQLDRKEAEYVNLYHPPLNTQIPDGFGGWTVNPDARFVRLEDII